MSKFLNTAYNISNSGQVSATGEFLSPWRSVSSWSVDAKKFSLASLNSSHFQAQQKRHSLDWDTPEHAPGRPASERSSLWDMTVLLLLVSGCLMLAIAILLAW